MHRQPKNINAPLEEKENESKHAEEKEEASFPALSRKQKICKVTKSKVIKASKKENLSDGNQAQLQKCTLKYTKGLEKGSCHNREDVVSSQFTECFFSRLKGDVLGERTLPLSSKENLARIRPVSLGDECCLTPKKEKAEEKSGSGISENQRKKPVDFATVTIAEFGISQESFTKRSLGKSPLSPLKYRRRSAIGARGSPENNSLIQYLAQQRSNRQNQAFTQQASPFKYENVRSLKDKINAFQASFKSVQEAERETGFSGRSQVDDAPQEAGSSQNKVPFTEERNLAQWSEKFTLGNSGDVLKESLKHNLTNSSRSAVKICTILSSGQDVTVTEPAAAVSKEQVYEPHNPIESLETVLMRDILVHDFSSDHIAKDVRSNVSDLSRKKVSFAEEVSLEIFDESKPPITPPVTPTQPGNSSLDGHGSQLRSVLKKTPTKQLMDGTKEYSSDAVHGGGGECLAVSNCAGIIEALQTEKTESHSSEKPKKKRVTFGEVLSPEIFDETLPANTPLRKGGTPVRHPGLQSSSPFAWSRLTEEPLPQPNFDCIDECIEPLEVLVESSVAAEDPSPVENAEAETGKSDMITTHSAKRKRSAVSEGTDLSISGATDAKNATDTKNPRKTKSQRQKNTTTPAAKKTQKSKHTGYGKRRKKKVKKSLYGEREMASKKPLLSPILEISEVLSAASSPKSPKSNAFFSEDIFVDKTKFRNACEDVQQKPVVERMQEENPCAVHVSSKDPDTVEASSSNDAAFQGSDGDLHSASGIDHKLSSIVPDGKCDFDASDYFQQEEETACVKEAKGSGSLIENKKLQGNLLNEAEQVTGLEFLEQQDTRVHEGAQRPQCPQTDSVTGSPPRRRRRRSSAIYFPPVENLEINGNSFPVSSFNVEEVLSAPVLRNDSSEPFRRASSSSGNKRVRRSMRLHKDAEIEGLAWIQVPSETQNNPPLLGSACKIRRRISTSILTESENIHHREQNLIQFSAPGKENHDSVDLTGGPCKRWRRSLCVSTPRETKAWSQTRRRSISNSVYREDRSNQKHSQEVPLQL
ncbi:PREDICTED: cell division cycle-associated protein 2, partial [Mesitornis unicolor]|uniref:cell division cycle-associated protein 2 n=1 Tax=Mesitornis unicolor TaxID=54374 RepID=UPI00052863BA